MRYSRLLNQTIAMSIMVVAINCSEEKKTTPSQNLWELLKSGVNESYRNEKQENLLHLAVLSGDVTLIRHVNGLFPQLRTTADSMGYTPAKTAVALCPLATIKLLDSLGFDFVSVAPDIAVKRLSNEQSENLKTPSVIKDPQAEAVYAYIASKLAKLAQWPRDMDVQGVFYEARQYLSVGYAQAADARLDLFRQHPERIKELINSGLPRDSVDASILCQLPLPADHRNGYYFFMALSKNQPMLTKAFIDQGAVVNNMSVQNTKVQSALTYAKASGSNSNVELLTRAGATDAYWYELLVPGFWPNITDNYDTSRVWYTVGIDKDSTFVRSGGLDPEYFCVQRKDYWAYAKIRAIFMVATNRPKGISTCETVVSRPRLLTSGDSLRITLNSGLVYELSAPPVAGKVLRVVSNGRHQDLLQEFPENYDNYNSQNSPPSNAVWVVWAGDVDGDGKLDLLITRSDYGNRMGADFYLTLSTLATGALLMGWADEAFVYESYDAFAHDKYGREYDSNAYFPYGKSPLR
jgi:hypothetical protein